MSQSLPRSMKVRGVRGDKEVGVTSVSFSQHDPDLFILGSESGCVFKCNLHAKGNPAGSESLICLTQEQILCILKLLVCFFIYKFTYETQKELVKNIHYFYKYFLDFCFVNVKFQVPKSYHLTCS